MKKSRRNNFGEKKIKKRFRTRVLERKKVLAKRIAPKKIEELASALSEKENGLEGISKENLVTQAEQFSQSGSFGTIKVSEEEIALELAVLYFREIARLGFKRSLEIDDVINSYYYALARIKRKDFESEEIMSVIRRAKKY